MICPKCHHVNTCCVLQVAREIRNTLCMMGIDIVFPYKLCYQCSTAGNGYSVKQQPKSLQGCYLSRIKTSILCLRSLPIEFLHSKTNFLDPRKQVPSQYTWSMVYWLSYGLVRWIDELTLEWKEKHIMTSGDIPASPILSPIRTGGPSQQRTFVHPGTSAFGIKW